MNELSHANNNVTSQPSKRATAKNGDAAAAQEVDEVESKSKKAEPAASSTHQGDKENSVKA